MRSTSYSEVVSESFADHIQSHGVDAGVHRRHVEADVVKNKKSAKTTSQRQIYMITITTNTTSQTPSEPIYRQYFKT